MASLSIIDRSYPFTTKNKGDLPRVIASRGPSELLRIGPPTHASYRKYLIPA